MSNEVTEWFMELWSEIKAMPSDFKGLINKWRMDSVKMANELVNRIEEHERNKVKQVKRNLGEVKKSITDKREIIVINKGSSITNLLLLYLCILNTLVVIAVLSTLLIVNDVLPVNELTYYTNRAVNFLQRCDGVDCADRLIAWIESDFPLNPELPFACGRIINGTVITEDCSQW